MKQETRELIEGLKVVVKDLANDNDGLTWLNCKSNKCLSQALDWSERIRKGEYKENISANPESNYNKLLSLLDKLEEVEECLKHGGFILDKNRKPCKDGDNIKITTFNNTIKYGKLKFDNYEKSSKFMLVFDNETWYLDEVHFWEKLEN